ncbi:putative 2-phosphoglycerate kinase [Thermococcus cleftensis]|uniref:2-phosphoglycerate kinase n=1 Tax=Thermococcus cleftensis (strain DSM 27260 / KACC 17922 / CL1) TaxID=163003 RepID=I3ZWQ2_THECF|nr:MULTISPECIES: 2-phosphoglycerate kinase [Thermococcus]AFL96136.1 putative 2-phosphoglycerate kinase [Thermococcus cleftensis]NJE02949.1 2-phosphoglycerate kinase [Thermococcus sp. MV11]
MIIVTDPERKMRLPFSRGILTRSITLAGVDVGVAYIIATEVQKELNEKGRRLVTTEEIRELTYRKLIEHGLEEAARRYLFWRQLRRLKVPITILLGGATGVGKSTIATELAFRLGIRSVIGTDTIREVMRKIIAPELLPDIHASSFLAWRTIHAEGGGGSPLIEGFKSQVKHVSVGVSAVLERAYKEGSNAIIEGIHLVPGYVELRENSFMYVITVGSERDLEARFYERARYSKRSADYYLEHLEEILEIQEFIVERAREHGVRVIENVELEKTVNAIMEDLMERLRERIGRG